MAATDRPSTEIHFADDIRNRRIIGRVDVERLNFIRSGGDYVMRRHFRQGLRSHVMALFDPDEIALEQTGVLMGGVRWFPRAQPLRIFRIFRARLETLDQALEEIRRVKMIEAYLAPDGFARSTEFVVDYLSPPGHAILLCGLQEFVDGEILNPWSLLNKETFLDHIYHALSCNALEPFGERRDWKLCARAYARRFVDNIKRMIMETGHVPDLAGVGNLIMTAQGAVKLVDINNSTRISPGGKIALDDKGYPVGDKSIEALSLLEEKMVERPVDRTEWIYQTILSPERMANVRMLTDAFQVKAVTG